MLLVTLCLLLRNLPNFYSTLSGQASVLVARTCSSWVDVLLKEHKSLLYLSLALSILLNNFLNKYILKKLHTVNNAVVPSAKVADTSNITVVMNVFTMEPTTKLMVVSLRSLLTS